MPIDAILLVEDNPDDATLTVRALTKNRIANEVVVTANGTAALDYLFGTGPHAGRDTARQPALVLLDLKLPGMDGVGVLRRIRANPLTRQLPVVILTTSGEDRDLKRGYDAGANSYIRKPVDFTRFTEVVRQLGLYWLAINQRPAAATTTPRTP